MKKPITGKDDGRSGLDGCAEQRLNAQLMEQEHRLFAILHNWRKYRKDDRFSDAVSRALIWRVCVALLPTAAVGGISATAVAGVYFAYRNTALVAQQNRRIDIQSHLIEGQRRASLNIELSAIMDSLEDLEVNRPTEGEPLVVDKLAESKCSDGTLNYPQAEPEWTAPLGAVLEARIVAISRALRPYRVIATQDLNAPVELSTAAVSPERGQLLLGLVDSGVKLQRVREEADFSYAELDGLVLNGRFLAGIALQSASLRGTRLIDVNLQGARMRGADLSGAVLSSANLSVAHLVDAQLVDADLRGAELYAAYLQKSNLTRADLDGACLKHANLEEADLRDAKGWRTACWSKAIIAGVKNAPSGFIGFALSNGATLTSKGSND